MLQVERQHRHLSVVHGNQLGDSTSRAPRVLLVEDSQRIAERLRELLTDAGMSVAATVDDESSAVRTLREMPIDILILDLQLRAGTGFGVLKTVGESRPPTIVLTNFVLPQYRERARLLGIEYFLNKAQDLERLPQILAEFTSSDP
jgi:DNA-binding response OmpR family regulator